MKALFLSGDHPVWVGLHGSGRDETDLPAFIRSFAPKAGIVSLRGSLASGPGFAFFKRHGDRTPDEPDLVARCAELERYLRDHPGMGAKPPYLFGVSNGAVMAAAIVLRHRILLSGAILIRPAQPFVHAPDTILDGLPILIIDGRMDTRRRPEDGRGLATQCQNSGATVHHYTVDGGHAPSSDDIEIIERWLGSLSG